MNRFEYKKRFDPEMGMYVKKHIYGEGMMDIFKLLGSKLLNKTIKETIKKGVQKGSEAAIKSAVEKSGNYASKRAGDKIVQLLSKKNKSSPLVDSITETNQKTKPLSQYEINERVNQILSGGKLRRKTNFM